MAKLADAYQIPTPSQSFVTSADEAGTLVESDNTPKVVKIVADEILHKTDVGGVVTDVVGVESMRDAFSRVVESARSHDPEARIKGALIQDQVAEGVEVIIGATTGSVFGKLVGFGIGGIMVEVLKDITFRLAPTSREQASQMLDEISGSTLLDGVRGKSAVQKDSLVDLICSVSQLVSDCPEIDEIDLNPVIATSTEAVAVDVRIILNFEEKVERPRPSRDEILAAMTRIMRPSAVAVVGASAEDGKIGNSVMRNLIDGGYQGHLYPVHPRADEILGHKCYPSVLEIPTDVDIAVFCIPARFVASVIAECGEKGIAGAVLIPSGFAEIGSMNSNRKWCLQHARTTFDSWDRISTGSTTHTTICVPPFVLPTPRKALWLCRHRAVELAWRSLDLVEAPIWVYLQSSDWGTRRTSTKTICLPSSKTIPILRSLQCMWKTSRMVVHSPMWRLVCPRKNLL